VEKSKEKKDQNMAKKFRKITLLSLFQGGGRATEKKTKQKIAKKN